MKARVDVFKLISLVTKRPDLSAEQFYERWVGNHIPHVLELPGIQDYVIDFVVDPALNDPTAIATVRFDAREYWEAAMNSPLLSHTTSGFAAGTRVLLVDEHVIKLASDEG